jgi:hypothetical protein
MPRIDRQNAGRRSHCLTVRSAIANAPGGRTRHRIGCGYEQLKDLGHELEQPAG